MSFFVSIEVLLVYPGHEERRKGVNYIFSTNTAKSPLIAKCKRGKHYIDAFLVEGVAIKYAR